MSARARFLEPLLWAVKIESLVDLKGRLRPAVVDAVEGEARSEERVDVKAALLALESEVLLEDLGWGRP